MRLEPLISHTGMTFYLSIIRSEHAQWNQAISTELLDKVNFLVYTAHWALLMITEIS